MKNNLETPLKTLPIICCLFLFACLGLGETLLSEENASVQSPAHQSPAVRADESNSWATLGRVYVILATTDDNETCGKVAQNNGEAVSRLFRTHIAQKAVTVLKIPPQNLSRHTVLSLLANLPLREDDAVVFYYSGSGAADRRYGQYFELPASKEEIYRSEVRSAILKRKTRLGVLIADCCDPASIVPPPVEAASTEPVAAPDENKPNEGDSQEDRVSKSATAENVLETNPLFFSLFFSSRGIIDINSSSFGQASCTNENQVGCFTEMFAGLLDVNSKKILSWQRVFPYIQEGTSLAFAKNFPAGADIGEGRQQKNQTPVLLQLGYEEVDSPTRPRIYPVDGDSDTNATVNADEERREEDRQAITQLVQQAIGELRPFDSGDRGTHENLKVLDTDNTFLGLDSRPFSKELAPVQTRILTPEIVQAQTVTPTTEGSENPPPPPPERVRLGIQAANHEGEGVIIRRVVDNYPGQKVGLEVGDVILEIDGKKISTEKEYSDAIDAASERITIKTRNKSGKIDTVTINMRETATK